MDQKGSTRFELVNCYPYLQCSFHHIRIEHITSSLDILGSKLCLTIKITHHPVSIVASKSALSTNGRLLSPHHNKLHPKIGEALICAKNWLWAETIKVIKLLVYPFNDLCCICFCFFFFLYNYLIELILLLFVCSSSTKALENKDIQNILDDYDNEDESGVTKVEERGNDS